MTRIELDDGKYTVVHDSGAGLHALRYGEHWRDMTGDGLVLAMAQEIEDLRRRIVPVQQVSVPDGKIAVSGEALRTVLNALVNVPHQIRELQVTREPVALFADNPINVLIAEYEAAHAAPAAPAADAGKLADAFLSWKLPDSVRPDGCAMDPTYPHRYGTNLMTWAQAKEMFEYVLVAHRANGVV